MEKYKVFIDESGNSGINIFDSHQPFFWVGVLILPERNLEELDRVTKEICGFLEVKELHGNELGLGKINDISKQLIKKLKPLNLKFSFVRIEKEHLETMKFVDCLIDSGINPAISPMHYNLSGLRFPIAQTVATVFNTNFKKGFWDIYLKRNIKRYKTLLSEFENASSVIPDPRMRQIIKEATNYGITNPDKLLYEIKTFKNKNSNEITDILSKRELSETEYKQYFSIDNRLFASPNLVAFSLLLNNMKKSFGATNSRVNEVIHDEQNEFALYLRDSFETMKGIVINNHPEKFTEATEVTIFDSNLKFLSSDSSSGLQIIDIFIWILQQVIDKEKTPQGDLINLINYVIVNSELADFSYEQLTNETENILNQIMGIEMTDEDLSKAKKILDGIEKARMKKLSSKS